MQADGYFAEYPIGVNGAALAPYQITAFAPAYDKDHLREHGLDAQWQHSAIWARSAT